MLPVSKTAYVPQLWDMPEGGYSPERILDTAGKDLWDAVALDLMCKTLKLFRFGTGFDRKVCCGESEVH